MNVLRHKREFMFGIITGSWITFLLVGQFALRQNVFQLSYWDYKKELKDTHFQVKHDEHKAESTSQPIASDDNDKQSSVAFSTSELINATQQARRSTIRAACQKHFPENSKCIVDKEEYIHERNLISRNYNVVVCDIFKCGFTSWLSAIYVMEDVYTVQDYLNNKIQGSGVIIKSNQKIRITGIQNQTLKRKLWKESIKVITVRNPFSRLVSAYYDKMLTTSPGHTKYFQDLTKWVNAKFRHLRHNATERNQTDDGVATFEDFVNYLLTIDITKCNPHFLSYLALCKPCDATYDYVIKFETMRNDMEYLKQHLNISDYHKGAVFPKKRFKTNTDIMEKTFKNIPNELALKLYKKYQKDFDVFGYEKPEWLC